MAVDCGRRRLAVRFDEEIWREAIRGFSGRARDVAMSARMRLANDSIEISALLPCESHAPDRTALSGCAKLYLPLVDAPPSERPYAFIFQLARERDSAIVLIFLAFGLRHPRPGVRTAYERAHRQLHGRFPT